MPLRRLEDARPGDAPPLCGEGGGAPVSERGDARGDDPGEPDTPPLSAGSATTAPLLLLAPSTGGGATNAEGDTALGLAPPPGLGGDDDT